MWVGFVEEFVLLGRVNRRFTSVVLTTGGIDDLCLKLVFYGGRGTAGRRCKKEDLKRIAKATQR